MNITRLIADRDLGTLEGVGTVGGSSNPVDATARIISIAVGFMTVMAAVYFIFNIITAAISIISSAGDKGNLESARTKMTHSLIGLVVTISALFLIDIISLVLGIPNVLDFGVMVGGLGG